MPTRAERTALLFLSAVILTGGVVRLTRSRRAGIDPAPLAPHALADQRRAVESVGHARGSAHRGEATPHSASARAPLPRAGAPARVSASEPRPAMAAPTRPVDLDRASAREIESLPRIGPALAARIVADRDTNGPFGSLDSLARRVKGIGPAMVKVLQPLVTFSGR